ncbi:magnesium transporter CorA family protein [Microbaculum marinisediminis]|uniref:Magnesium transport protein CorA n=1 Tax=Microbaculum marinisediminis TaxID=2931392 RepID=A0AAW5QUC2_9HYPH|nr:magnesium transporter CorA family protein [Microbaculum sp. A6E488]MCT8971283.1 magnesium transporter CorA family protein [Microbaculum sp. A6E488]
MLSIHVATDRGLQRVPDAGALTDLPTDAVWIDLLNPTSEEEALLERWLTIDVPSREEMREIEISSRLFEEDGALYMTVVALLNADGENPTLTDVTFILVGGRLVTVRYAEPRPITLFLQRAPKIGPACQYADFVLVGLIEAFIDRIADVLEHAGLDADRIGDDVFLRESSKPIKTDDFKKTVARIARTGDLTSKARESLVTISRLLTFMSAGPGSVKLSKDVKLHLKTAVRDANQLADHATYLATKTEFLLDATMGLINIEQTNIIKIFSVAAVAMMPPTLIASIYGMNFQFMPELNEKWAYPMVLVVMIASALAPYFYFKRKGWL